MCYGYCAYRRVIPMRVEDYRDQVMRFAKYYGDDLRKLFRVPGVGIAEFQAAMRTLNQVVTDSNGQKGDLIVATKGGKTFLKRGFRRVGGRVFCPLEVSSLVKSLLFYVPSGDERVDAERHLACLRTVWDECVFHEPAVSEQVRAMVRACLVLVHGGDRLLLASDEELIARWDAGRLRVWEL
jgi:hypothetical protein